MSGTPVPSKEQLDGWSIEAQRELAEGSPERACQILRRLIEAWTRLQGPDGERVLAWRGFLGRALVEARRNREAEQVLSDLLVDRVRVEGDEARGTLVTRGNLARAVALGGRPREAIVLAQRLLEDRTRLLGADHPSTLDTRGHIAHFHYLADQAPEAVRQYEALLADRVRVLGPTHPAVAATEANLRAVRSKATGADADLEELRRHAHESFDGLGPDHPDTIVQHALVAERLVGAGRFIEAFDYCNWTCDARARLLGERDAMTVSARVLRAKCLVGLGRAAEARDELERLVNRLADAGLGQEATSLKARCELLALLLESSADDETQGRAAFDLWCGLYGDSRHLEPGNPLREWIEEQGCRFEEPEDHFDEAFDEFDVAALAHHRADERHYRTAYVAFPRFLFGEMGPAVVAGFLRGDGPELMAAIWQQEAGEPIDEGRFTVEARSTGRGSCVIVIGMPSTGAPPEAAYLGLYVPAAVADRLQGRGDDHEVPAFVEDITTTSGLRLFSIEHALFGTMIGEVLVGRHLNLGMGPDPSIDAMFAVVVHETGEELV